MLRTAILAASLCALVACDRATPTTLTGPVAPGVAQPVRSSLRGIVRLGGDSTEVQWNLELRDGSLVRLIGDPVAQIAMYEGLEVSVTGVYDNGVMLVESYITQIIPDVISDASRRRR